MIGRKVKKKETLVEKKINGKKKVKTRNGNLFKFAQDFCVWGERNDYVTLINY